MGVRTEEYKELICDECTERRYILSYRRYQKLSQKEKDEFDKYKNQYLPNVWALALLVAYKKGIPFNHRLFERCQKIKDDKEWYDEQHTYQKGEIPKQPVTYDIKDEYLEQELIFQGFVPIDQYNIKIGYVYIATNRSINGKFYIYPKRFYGPKCYGKLEKIQKYPVVWDYYESIGIPGITMAVQSESQVKTLIENQEKWKIQN